MPKPNIPKNPTPKHTPTNRRNAIVNLLENVDGAQLLKNSGDSQDSVMAYLRKACDEFRATPGVVCDQHSIGFGITLNRIVIEVKYSDDSGEYEVTYTARRHG